MLNKITVLIADDHEIIRMSLTHLLARDDRLDVIGTAANGCEALQMVEQASPDVVLMDLSMPEMDGLTATQKIKRLHPEVIVIMFTAYLDHNLVYQSMKAGATGYLVKDAHPGEIAEVIVRAARGEVCLQPQAARLLFERLHTPKSIDRLTEREMSILRLVAKGYSNSEIAHQLKISEKTIKSYMSSILSKLQLASRTQAAIHALREGVVGLDQAEPAG
jgi:NarL family two-component system response regulator LiaR